MFSNFTASEKLNDLVSCPPPFHSQERMSETLPCCLLLLPTQWGHLSRAALRKRRRSIKDIISWEYEHHSRTWRDSNTCVDFSKIRQVSVVYKLGSHMGKFIIKSSIMWCQPLLQKRLRFTSGLNETWINRMFQKRIIEKQVGFFQKTGGKRRAGAQTAAVSRSEWWARRVLGQWNQEEGRTGKGLKHGMMVLRCFKVRMLSRSFLPGKYI